MGVDAGAAEAVAGAAAVADGVVAAVAGAVDMTAEAAVLPGAAGQGEAGSCKRVGAA